MKKQILVNGIVVGEFEATGHQDKDTELMRDYVESKGLLKKISVPSAIHAQAKAFADVAAYLYNGSIQVRDPSKRVPSAFVPFVVNSTFAAELLLKAIGRLDGLEVRGHDLLSLYQALPQSAKAEIEAKSIALRATRVVPAKATFAECLEKHRGAFEEWRYVYEKPRSSRIEFDVLIHCLEVLQEVCRDNRAKIEALDT